jgi:hypothetical protein
MLQSLIMQWKFKPEYKNNKQNESNKLTGTISEWERRKASAQEIFAEYHTIILHTPSSNLENLIAEFRDNHPIHSIHCVGKKRNCEQYGFDDEVAPSLWLHTVSLSVVVLLSEDRAIIFCDLNGDIYIKATARVTARVEVWPGGNIKETVWTTEWALCKSKMTMVIGRRKTKSK